MQKEGKVRFLKYHEKAVKSVSFNPKERYIFASCSSDGKVGASQRFFSKRDSRRNCDEIVHKRSSPGLIDPLKPDQHLRHPQFVLSLPAGLLSINR